ncbi:hypothetical protein PCE1_000719 [Barthelona sp. PCE]
MTEAEYAGEEYSMPLFEGVPIYLWNFEELFGQNAPWNLRGVSIDDYFNYSFTPASWMDFCQFQMKHCTKEDILKWNLQKKKILKQGKLRGLAQPSTVSVIEERGRSFQHRNNHSRGPRERQYNNRQERRPTQRHPPRKQQAVRDSRYNYDGQQQEQQRRPPKQHSNGLNNYYQR